MSLCQQQQQLTVNNNNNNTVSFTFTWQELVVQRVYTSI
jgi:hypothetical protein